MGFETWFVFGVLGATIVLFAADKLRLDLVALLALMTLLVARVLTPEMPAPGGSRKDEGGLEPGRAVG